MVPVFCTRPVIIYVGASFLKKGEGWMLRVGVVCVCVQLLIAVILCLEQVLRLVSGKRKVKAFALGRISVMFSSYSKRQWIILILFGLIYLMFGVCIYIQAPFFPTVASQIGASAFQYSCVFSSFHFVSLLMAPLTAKLMMFVDPYVIAKAGILMLGCANTLFGFLNYIYDLKIFLTLAILIRIVESCGYTTFVVSALSIIAEEFLDDIATVTACMQSSLGTGLIIGPGIGGFLYEYGGFTLPFLVTGVMILLILALTLFVKSSKRDIEMSTNYKDAQHLLKKPECLLAVWSLCNASFAHGFIEGNLSSHLSHLILSESKKSLFFMLFGLFYSLFCPIWGRLLDSGGKPHFVWCSGAILTCTSMLLLGPAPYLNIALNIPLCCISLILFGIGIASQFVSSFFCFHKVTLYLGFPDDVGTYGIVSGLFSFCISFGGIIGPSVGGWLNDTFGMPWGLHVIVFLNVLLLLSTILYSCSAASILADLSTFKKQELDLLLK